MYYKSIYMRYLKNILFLLIIVMATKSNAQNNNDSATIDYKVAGLKKQLTLTDKQCEETKILYKQLLRDRDSVNAINLTPENRAVFLSAVRTKYHSALQSILSVEQWKIYDDKQKAIGQAFKLHVKEQKNKYTFLNNQ